MNRFFEYTVNHPFLVAAAAILAVLAIAIELRARARGGQTVSAADAVRLANSGALLLDVRDAKAYESGHIIEARQVAEADVAARIDSFKKYKEKPVLLYCETGFASSRAAKALRAAGFTKVATLQGGLHSWRQENLPLVKGAAKGKQA